MASVAVSPPTARLGILDLPKEIQQEICSHCSQCDLICLSLVCKRFREAAAAQLYRNFHIVFPDEDDPTFDSPIDGLAGGLDTFVTSDYNYAQHLRDLSLDTLSAGDKAETAYKPYLSTVSCGKFMNTLLLLTLRRARSLDTFKWNIRVELSRPVYNALHRIDSLKNLHVRMQSGPSLYEKPPPLPYNSFTAPPLNVAPPPIAAQWSNNITGSNATPGGPNPNILSVIGPFSTSMINQPSPFASTSTVPPVGSFTTYAPPPPPPVHNPIAPAHKPPPKPKAPKKQTYTTEPPTIAGFKNLESLAVLDIDNLDIIPEIQTCVRNSASTLKKLKLSFSDYLASQARKPTVDLDPNESDDDDDFQVVPMNNNYDDGTGPARAFRAQEERKAQEAVLSRILDVENSGARAAFLAKKDKRRSREPARRPPKPLERQREFLNSIQEVSKRLSASTQLSIDVSKQKEILDLIMEASKMYIADVKKGSGRWCAADGSAQPTSQKAAASSDSERTDGGGSASASTLVDGHIAHSSKTKAKDDGSVEPDDIDIVTPEGFLNEEAPEESNQDATPTNEPSLPSTAVATPTATNSTNGTPSINSSAAVSVAAPKESHDPVEDDETLELLMQQTGERLETMDRDMKDIQHELNLVEAEIEEAEVSQGLSSDEAVRQQMNDYVRDTRGIALKSLGIHHIPVKASVLGRAIDLRALNRITLLNVGNQAPIWTLLAKENKIQPLPLRKLFTDNVSLPFLQLVSQLNIVEELFMLERGAKYKPESFAPKTNVTLPQIHRAILKKHMPTIRCLIIKNQADSTWDIDEKTMQLVCKRGKAMEELAVSMGIRAVHAFLQYLSGLVKLRALHIISFRSDDTCLSVMRETRHFIVDTVSHHPELQLEWISMGDDYRSDRIIRKTDALRKPKKTKGKGKEVSISMTGTLGIADPFPILPTEGWDESSSEEDDDADDLGSSAYLKLDLIESICYYDIWGVRIFKKEVIGARL